MTHESVRHFHGRCPNPVHSPSWDLRSPDESCPGCGALLDNLIVHSPAVRHDVEGTLVHRTASNRYEFVPAGEVTRPHAVPARVRTSMGR